MAYSIVTNRQFPESFDPNLSSDPNHALAARRWNIEQKFKEECNRKPDLRERIADVGETICCAPFIVFYMSKLFADGLSFPVRAAEFLVQDHFYKKFQRDDYQPPHYFETNLVKSAEIYQLHKFNQPSSLKRHEIFKKNLVKHYLACAIVSYGLLAGLFTLSFSASLKSQQPQQEPKTSPAFSSRTMVKNLRAQPPVI